MHDLLIIGGGITGAGTARDAALRGLDVILVEQDDIASGTSSRSSRLVHGGVRYLEHGHLRLVFESSRERRILLETAPHLVRPLAFTWPVYRGARLPRWKVGAGLALYDALALLRNVGRHSWLGVDGVREREPALQTAGLTGGLSYWDASTDDSRLTLATARDAAALGAEIRTHTEVLSFLREGSRVVGARVQNRLHGSVVEIRARQVICAAGPWTDELLRRDPAGAAETAPAVRGTKGVHVLLPRELVGNSSALTLVAPDDGRIAFVLPSGDFALVGTTDTPADASPSEVRASRVDIEYLLRIVRHHFPERAVEEGDVVSAWAGIRPLAAAAYGDGPSSASREHAIVERAPGLIVVTGGKLTTYRSMAAEIVDVAARVMGTRLPASGTHERVLPGGGGHSALHLAEAERVIGDVAVAARLTSAHGSEWSTVWALAEHTPALAERLSDSHPYVLAEAVYAARCEWARTLADVLVRRVPLAFETRDHGREAASRIAPFLARELGWNEARTSSELERYETDVNSLFGVDDA